jgi:uncharacterized protein (TIGR02271 family)
VNQGTGESGRGGVVAGLFRGSDGDRALADLKAAGFTQVEISQVGGDGDTREAAGASKAYDVASEGARASTDRPSAAAGAASAAGPFFREHDSSASSFVKELVRLGFSKRDAHDLVDGLVKGDALVTADAGTDLDRAVVILSRYEADIRYTTGTSRAPAGAGATQASIDAAVARSAVDENPEIQLRAERLVVNKQRVQHGEARVRTEIVTEMKSIDVPVSHEELVIERHAVTGGGDVDSEPSADETIRIPLTEEKVNISKETVVREEVEVGTRRVEEVAHISDTVRHEELRVDDTTTNPATPRVTPEKP